MEINASIQETKIILWHSSCAYILFAYRTDASHNTRCSCALNTQLPQVIAERAIHHGNMDGWSFGQSKQNFLLTS